MYISCNNFRILLSKSVKVTGLSVNPSCICEQAPVMAVRASQEAELSE